MSDKRRVNKVAEKIRAILSQYLIRNGDSRLSLITLTSVIVSPDLRIAKVYWTASGAKDRMDEIEEALEDSSGAFRKAVGEDLGTRFVPHLKFFYDDTLDTVEQVERLFAKIRAEDQAKEKE